MSFRVLIMSPLHNMGSTVAATMLAQGITFDSKSSMLLFTSATSALPTYLGIDNINDPTRSIMQIIKLIDNGAISDKDILDYAFSYTKNGYLMNVADKTLPDKDRAQVISHVFDRSPTNVTIVDNSDDLDTRASKSLLEMADLVYVVIDQSQKSFERLKLWMQTEELKNNPNVYVIVTEYNEVVYSVRDLARHIGFPGTRVCKIHYNPWITKCCLTGTLQTVLPLAMELDHRVANLSNDIKELQMCINGAMIMKTNK